MASTISFKPDDFEDNNPFAEPSDEAFNTQHPEVEDSHEVEQTQETGEVSTTQQTETQIEHEDSGSLVKKELMKLLPERFSDKYSMQLILRNIEPNKPGNPILRFDAKVTGMSKYRQGTYKDIRRTYNEIVKFNNYLIVSNLEVFVPRIPSPQTSYPTGGEEENKRLFYIWQEWFDRLTQNPILVRDEEFVFFIENDFGYSVINSGRKSSVASGLVRKTLKQLAPPYDPYVELAEFRPMIKSAYLLLQRLLRAMEKNQKNERQLSSYISELATKLKGLSHFETVHPGMKNMWEKLAKITQIMSDSNLIQSISDMGTLGDSCQALVDDFYEIKEALTNRHLIMRELLHAQAQTQAKHAQATKFKNKSSLDPIKVDEALRALDYATKAEESLQMQVKRISGEMIFEKREVVNFIESKFQKTLKQFTLGRVEQHRRFLKSLENIRIDIRIIDQNGGLSRLNRDNLTQMKHNLPSSQAANGDSWSSRTFRSLAADHELKEQSLRQQAEMEGAVVDAKQAACILGAATF
ncbi:putative vacuolar protein sorting-associated protein [Clavispora lusitaniae]|uniref:Vacuolar protein sorting-associated protein 17 n=3 Tax=Clavispora lusitaniae TaxID=36911 RepID=C4Y021_CLAL4|nr:uncharacterized protein CLUG_01553 [Clavispora lusitaniae ATCC 42720]KAF5212197.1 Vacuolar protein sorting-associated protein 17 [Clavispora lusitaniae]EEQ37430.1 hypothetical protein CLUG_01553 [Clavispora lusitaniae ATCC 42720]KAF7583604.1 Vps5 C terminal like family protein [Clavispora lusitaniae]OVF09213.1 putative vacuolar protein sorting-associated protein [Clavispora lusitaniae]QFZ26435.1 putative vacuolar protein sorting-associated protein [Clavispora lusitaniae]